jgi:hypothetical protein
MLGSAEAAHEEVAILGRVLLDALVIVAEARQADDVERHAQRSLVDVDGGPRSQRCAARDKLQGGVGGRGRGPSAECRVSMGVPPSGAQAQDPA